MLALYTVCVIPNPESRRREQRYVQVWGVVPPGTCRWLSTSNVQKKSVQGLIGTEGYGRSSKQEMIRRGSEGLHN